MPSSSFRPTYTSSDSGTRVMPAQTPDFIQNQTDSYAEPYTQTMYAPQPAHSQYAQLQYAQPQQSYAQQPYVQPQYAPPQQVQQAPLGAPAEQFSQAPSVLAQPTQPLQTTIYALVAAAVSIALSVAYPVTAMIFVAAVMVVASLRGSRIQARMKNPNVSRLALSFALPWHLVRACLVAIVLTIGTFVMFVSVNTVGILIVRQTGLVSGFGNWTPIFATLNVISMALSWLAFLGRPQPRTARLGLRTKAPLTTRTLVITGVDIAGIIALILVSASVNAAIFWSPLPNLQSSLLATISSFV